MQNQQKNLNMDLTSFTKSNTKWIMDLHHEKQNCKIPKR